MSGRSRRGIAVTILQYALGLAALAWLLSQVDLGRVVDLLATLDATTVLAVLAVSVAGLLARFYTWYAVIDPRGPVRFREAANTDLIVNFVNQLLPSRLSGRVAAPFVLRSETGIAYTDATAIAGVHTGIYAVLYGLTAAVGVLAVLGRLPFGLIVLLAGSTGLYLAAGAFVLLAGTNLELLDVLLDRIAGLAALVPRVGSALADRIRGLTEFTTDSTDAFRALAASPGVWLRYALGWTGALVLAPAARVVLLLGAFGAAFEPAILLPVVLVAAYSVTLLPLTPGGIGVTEATATAVFVALGVPGEIIVPVVFVDRFLGTYLPAVAGWYPSLKIDTSSLAPDS
ncbi:lysylphosphatidylglycerol synthase transmembrane domain-containing protein [Halorientalis halophila]|uniref:lysylphosphatidylglycerol synthase transmembrane domain-containing protein n=1 Tax=Halorientalis halophila TaxID=3108499 RepID=UPI00300AE1F4